MDIEKLKLNMPELKQVVGNKITEYNSMLENEIRLVGLRGKIENRLETLNKIQALLVEHQDVKTYETTCGECGEELEKDSMYGYCDDCI